MKVIFLDIDGVLNNEYSESRCGKYIGIDDDKVELLKQIVDKTGAIIVLSSTWRLGTTRYGQSLEHHHEYMNEKLGKYGLGIYDVTPELSQYGDLRGKEINIWLQEHKDLNIESWIVLDDEFFLDFNLPQYDILDHWVKTDYYDSEGGLSQEHVDKAVKILNLVKDS